MTAPDTRPGWITNYPTYEGLVDSFGVEILGWEVTGYSGGDHVVLLAGGMDRRGFLVIGYGSCPGCDVLESAYDDEDWPAVIALAESIEQSIHWEETPEEMAAFLEASIKEPNANSWYDYAEDVKVAKGKFVRLLRGEK